MAEQTYTCTRSAAGPLYTIIQGEKYTESDFRPGGLKDALRAGWLRVDGEEKPTRKRKVEK